MHLANLFIMFLIFQLQDNLFVSFMNALEMQKCTFLKTFFEVECLQAAFN